MDLGGWGDLTILAAVMEIVFATCVFVYISRLENRTAHPLGEKPSLSYVRLVGARLTHRLIHRRARQAAYTWRRTPLLPWLSHCRQPNTPLTPRNHSSTAHR